MAGRHTYKSIIDQHRGSKRGGASIPKSGLYSRQRIQSARSHYASTGRSQEKRAQSRT